MTTNSDDGHVDGFVRVTDRDTGVKRTVPVHELPHGNYTQLKGATHDPRTGEVLPPEPPATPTASNAPAAKKTAAKKTAAKKTAAKKTATDDGQTGQSAATSKEQ